MIIVELAIFAPDPGLKSAPLLGMIRHPKPKIP